MNERYIIAPAPIGAELSIAARPHANGWRKILTRWARRCTQPSSSSLLSQIRYSFFPVWKNA